MRNTDQSVDGFWSGSQPYCEGNLEKEMNGRNREVELIADIVCTFYNVYLEG